MIKVKNSLLLDHWQVFLSFSRPFFPHRKPQLIRKRKFTWKRKMNLRNPMNQQESPTSQCNQTNKGLWCDREISIIASLDRRPSSISSHRQCRRTLSSTVLAVKSWATAAWITCTRIKWCNHHRRPRRLAASTFSNSSRTSMFINKTPLFIRILSRAPWIDLACHNSSINCLLATASCRPTINNSRDFVRHGRKAKVNSITGLSGCSHHTAKLASSIPPPPTSHLRHSFFNRERMMLAAVNQCVNKPKWSRCRWINVL